MHLKINDEYDNKVLISIRNHSKMLFVRVKRKCYFYEKNRKKIKKNKNNL